MRLTQVFSVMVAATLAASPNIHAQTTGSGTVSGTFVTPAPTCLTSAQIIVDVYVPICDGVGTNHVSWGNATGENFAQSSLTFTPAPFLNVAVGEFFTLGTLRYFNGSTYSGTSIGAITLSIVTSSATPAMNAQTLLLPFSIFPTINGVSREADADFIYFTDAVGFGSFRVVEGEFSTVELRGRFGSLHNEGFGQIVSGTTPTSGFLNPSVQAQIVPEPSTLLLSGAGLAVLLLLRRRLSNT